MVVGRRSLRCDGGAVVKCLKSSLDPAPLASLFHRLESRRDGTGVEMTALQFHEQSSLSLLHHDEVKAAVDELESLTGGACAFIMFNRLAPGAGVPAHVDAHSEPVERWHLPVATNPQAWWWDLSLGESLHMRAGWWWGPVPYSVFHRVWNDGDSERIHLVVDLL